MILFPTVLSPQYYLQETHAINDFFGTFFSLQPSNFFFFLKLFKLNFIFHGIFFFKRMLLLKRSITFSKKITRFTKIKLNPMQHFVSQNLKPWLRKAFYLISGFRCLECVKS